MPDLKIVVCLKVVPKSEEVSVNAETNTLERGNARSEINGADMNALQMALELKDTHGGSVALLSMGPPFAERYLRLGMAMGADAAYLMSDRAFGGADTLPTSYALAEGLKALGECDLVICGEESSDGATGQVPAGIAEWLDVPQLTGVTSVQLLPKTGVLRAHRELRGGYEVDEAPLPCVISVRLGANEPRFIDFDRWDWALDDAKVTVWTAADLGLDESKLGLKGSATVVAGVAAAAAAERRREFIDGTSEEKVQQLLERIKTWTRP
jgi:electron transfer flavoprotein beta subunit